MNDRVPAFILALLFGVLALSCSSEDGASGQRQVRESTRATTTEPAHELDLSGGDSPSTAPDGEPVDLNESMLSPLPAGTYRTGVFEPAFTFTVPDGLHLLVQLPYGLGLAPDPTATIDVDADVFSVSRLEDVQVQQPVLPDPGEEAVPVPVPDDIVGWLTDIEYLKTSAPEPVTVGGLEGMVLDFTVDLPDDRGPCTPILVRCILLFHHTPTGVWTFFPDDKIARIWVLDSDREPVLIIAETTPGTDADKFLDEAEQIVSTIDFG